ncbi:MAG TPA: 4-alpha-glucanotransferase [Rubrivivax sp.]|nr:4-alpha-glucanotransferase [Rubrivivax sp.]HPO19076.1 4-alpha-glucanotransferase [Rubrivivax sp.]
MRLPRASGVLLHPTSLPGPHGSGDCGAAACHFVDWLVQAGQSLWQILPLNPIGAGNSPYASSSAFAGNLLLVDLLELQQQGWLTSAEVAPLPGLLAQRVAYDQVVPFRMQRLQWAAERFFAVPPHDERHQAFAQFCAHQAGWLDDYALFMALDEAHSRGHADDGSDWRDWRDWCGWPEALARRDPGALAEAAATHAARVAFWKFGQWCFFRQWQGLRQYANRRGVRIVGDVPIFIAHHSAEVWAHQALFELGADGRPSVVAGVPPDYFSATGQRWGNPLYRWDVHARDGYAWWVQRLRCVFELVDIVRIDHFRGFAAHWEIAASEPTAQHGHWRAGPGAALFEAIAAALGTVPIIAEDLGLITPDVQALRRRFALPGMRILQFAFGGEADNAYLPHHHEPDSVVYPGTHDNDTALGWWAAAGVHERSHARDYLGLHDGDDIAWALIRCACASVADTAVFAMQDVLSLGGDARLNFPGQANGWWSWRLQWSQVQHSHAQRLYALCRLYDRLPCATRA